MTRIGLTGSRKGMKPKQQEVFAALVEEYAPFELHHGDCVGTDEYAHKWYYCYSHHQKKIVVHPPSNSKLRAYCGALQFIGNFVVVREEKDYFSRNRDIVDETDWLMAFPNGSDGSARNRQGGTWYTIRYAQEVNKKALIVFANGEKVWI